MDYFLVVFLFFLGSLNSFLSSILSGFNSEILFLSVGKDDKSFAKLMQLRSDFDDDINSFILIELTMYMSAALILGNIIQSHGLEWYYMLAAILLLAFPIFVLRTILAAIGFRFADKLALSLFSMISFFSLVAKPMVNMLNSLSIRISGRSREDSRQELSEMFESAREEGSIDTDEYRILRNIMHFKDVFVTDVMTPRTVIFSCEADSLVKDTVGKQELQMYSRFPIWEGDSLDAGVIGYVMSRDVMNAALKGRGEMKLRDFVREVYFIPENAELDNALDQFLRRRQHLFIAVDEYGGVEGIITMEDVLETILGVEIVDEADKVVDLRLSAKSRRDKRVANLELTMLK
jgi:magnesium and cobalt exporter, CNNM family